MSKEYILNEEPIGENLDEDDEELLEHKYYKMRYCLNFIDGWDDVY